MRQSKLGHGKHLQNVAFEDVLGFVEIRVGKIFDHVLLRGVIDEDV